VHVLDAPGARLTGAHVSVLTVIGKTRLIVALCEEPFSDAVTFGVSFAVNCFAIAENVALLEPAATLTDAGTVRLVELDDKVTLAPVDALSVTVHVLDAPGARLTGAHVRLLTVVEATGVTVPPVLVMLMLVPVGEAPRTLVTLIDAVLLPESVTVTAAMTPSPIVVAFIPAAIQVYPPAPLAQVRVLPAADSAAPAVALKLETAAEENVRVH